MSAKGDINCKPKTVAQTQRETPQLKTDFSMMNHSNVIWTLVSIKGQAQVIIQMDPMLQQKRLVWPLRLHHLIKVQPIGSSSNSQHHQKIQPILLFIRQRMVLKVFKFHSAQQHQGPHWGFQCSRTRVDNYQKFLVYLQSLSFQNEMYNMLERIFHMFITIETAYILICIYMTI